MDIHVVKPGDTLYSIALSHGVPMSRLLEDNQLPDPSRLVVGQTIVIQYPERTYVVRSGDTLFSIAQANGLTVKTLLRNNPSLAGEDRIFPGQELVLAYRQEKQGTLTVNGYAYPHIDRALLQRTLPYLSGLLPFSYEATALGELTPLDDVALVDAAKQTGVVPIMNITNLTPDGMFSPELAHIILSDPAIQEKLAANVMEVIRARSYQGLDVDFESIYAEDAQSYVSFISRLRELAAPMGIPVLVAVAPKSYANQPGLLYEGMDYAGLGRAADLIFLMTYEWGYSYGPPMAISPIRSMRTVIEYALKEIPAEKLLLGIPNYGYDWQIPYSQSRKAVSISNQYAVSLAARYYAAIRFDESVQAPWFRSVDERGQEHEVWFEDARSIRAKLSLVPEYGLRGVGYWNLMRPFPQNWVILNALYHIREGL